MKKIGRFSGLLGIALGTSILSGCETTDSNLSGWDALNIFAMSKPGSTLSQQEAAAGLSSIAGTMAQREHEMNVAREGRSQVNQENNVYSGQNSQPYQQAQPKTIVNFMVYNYWFDRNGDGKIDIPDEYIGIEKQSFHKNEKIELAAHLQTSGIKGKELDTKIYSPKGEEIVNTRDIIDYDFISYRMGEKGDLMSYLVNRGGIGIYNVKWYIDGNLASNIKFKITE
ncbi:hypothetical protein HYT26_02895 [Candidatus Pacearchaeota archaeon]|nr:hypothetical protein [Candidatus Pacearchaeota archaeon]